MPPLSRAASSEFRAWPWPWHVPGSAQRSSARITGEVRPQQTTVRVGPGRLDLVTRPDPSATRRPPPTAAAGCRRAPPRRRTEGFRGVPRGPRGSEGSEGFQGVPWQNATGPNPDTSRGWGRFASRSTWAAIGWLAAHWSISYDSPTVDSSPRASATRPVRGQHCRGGPRRELFQTFAGGSTAAHRLAGLNWWSVDRTRARPGRRAATGVCRSRHVALSPGRRKRRCPSG